MASPTGIYQVGERREKPSARFVICILVLLCMILITMLLAITSNGSDAEAFVYSCRVGSLAVLLSVAVVVVCNKGLAKPGSIIMYAFCAFQYGVPMIVAINPSYTDFTMGYLSTATMTPCSWFSVICIEFYALGSIIASYSCASKPAKKKAESKLVAFAFGDDRLVSRTAKVIFIIAGIVAYFYMIWFAVLSLSSGISVARDVISTNAVRNLARGFFIPSGFLLLIFTNSDRAKKGTFVVLLVYALIGTLSGDRTEAMTLLVALVYFWAELRTANVKTGTKLLAFFLFLAIILMLPWVAQHRVGNTVSASSLGDVIQSVFAEMGYNFYSVCFQSMYIDRLHYGASYLISLLALIPSSLMPTSVRQFLQVNLPANWIDTVMASNYNWAIFGQGYSMIAESAYNFGNAGFLVIGVFGYVIQRLVQVPLSGNKKFSMYLSLVLLWAFTTIPRRGFNEMVNSLEYDVLFIFLIMWVVASLAQSRKNRRTGKFTKADAI